MQPAALAATASLSALAFGPAAGIAAPLVLALGPLPLSLPPPPATSTMTTAITAAMRMPPPTICNRRERAAADCAWRSCASRSSRRRCFSSCRLDIAAASLASSAAAAPSARPPTRHAPAVFDEACDLAGQPIGGEAQLDDRLGLQEAAARQLVGEHPGVGERVHRIAPVPDHQRRDVERPPL